MRNVVRSETCFSFVKTIFWAFFIKFLVKNKIRTVLIVFMYKKMILFVRNGFSTSYVRKLIFLFVKIIGRFLIYL